MQVVPSLFGGSSRVSGFGFRELLYRNVKRFRGGLVFKARRLLYHSTPGLRVIKKKNKVSGFGFRVSGFGCREQVQSTGRHLQTFLEKVAGPRFRVSD